MKISQIFEAFLMAAAIACFVMIPATAGNRADAPMQERQPTPSDEQTPSVQFLKALHQLILNPPMTPEKITAAFGWPVLETAEDAIGRHFRFSLYPNQKWANPRLSVKKNSDKSNFVIQLMRENMCIPSEDVLVEFGTKFKPTVASIEGAPDYSTVSEAIKRNEKLFLYGPRYHIETPVKAVVGFDFTLSECLSFVRVYHPTY